MARCASDGCQRWCPDIFTRRGAGTSIDGRWFCSARCVERMLRGPVTPRLPASFLQLHRGAEVWLDRAAASRL